MFVIVLGQHVSILIESSSGPSKKIDPHLKCFKNALWDPGVFRDHFFNKVLTRHCLLNPTQHF